MSSILFNFLWESWSFGRGGRSAELAELYEQAVRNLRIVTSSFTQDDLESKYNNHYKDINRAFEVLEEKLDYLV